jgi:hypothetical protein
MFTLILGIAVGSAVTAYILSDDASSSNDN